MFKQHFTLPEGSIYLNCAAQGPLSNVASAAVMQSVKDKQYPAGMDQAYGEQKTSAARNAVSKLIDFPEKNIALADSTSWGINVLVQGLPLQAGDEVIMCAGQFPSNVAPWEVLKTKGVAINKVSMKDYIFDMETFKKSVTPKTKVACLEWVHFVSGDRIPLKEISAFCAQKNISVVVDITQGLGAIPFSMQDLKPDAVVCSAYKWLLSPYGSGFLALSDKLISKIDTKIINWLCFENLAFSGNLADCSYKLCESAKKFDVFAHMGYLNTSAMTESIKLLTELGPSRVYEYSRGLIEQLELNPEFFEPVNKGAPERQSLITTFKIKKLNGEGIIEELKTQKITASLRQGYLRIAPYLYNSKEEIRFCAQTLNQFASSGTSTTRPSKAIV